MRTNTRNNKNATDELFVEDALVESLTDLRDSLRNKEEIHEKYTMRTIELEFEPQAYTPRDIKKMRDRFRVSQAVFARLLGVKVKTVQSWEQGDKGPPRIARRLLDIMDQNPEQWINVLRESRRDRNKVTC